MADKWLHEINLRGNEDIDALIGYAEGLGFTLEAAASEKDNGQDWPDARAASHRNKLMELLTDVAMSGVSFDDERLGYVEVQINRRTWDELQRLSPTKESEE